MIIPHYKMLQYISANPNLSIYTEHISDLDLDLHNWFMFAVSNEFRRGPSVWYLLPDRHKKPGGMALLANNLAKGYHKTVILIAWYESYQSVNTQTCVADA